MTDLINNRWLPFEEARKIVRRDTKRYNLKSSVEWHEIYKLSLKPNNIPSSPRAVYKKQWIGWGHWLGTDNEVKKKI